MEHILKADAEKYVKDSRYGAYGVFCKDDHILLTQKKSGPYKGLWDLPGGAIEFGESPEEALKREFLEETALAITHFDLFCTTTSNGIYEKNHALHHFHHIGIIYKVKEGSMVPHALPEEEACWMKLPQINIERLTPFAKQVLKNLSYHNT